MNGSAVAIDTSTQDLDGWFDARFDKKMSEREAAKTPSMTIIATKGTLDAAYPPFILASTAAALGWEVSVFFTCSTTARKSSSPRSPSGWGPRASCRER